MRILVVGAGSIGGYFGGRLLQAGRDVTFLVRPRRAEALAHTGLCVTSPCGDFTISNPPTVGETMIAGPFDVIVLSCKAYDLAAAMDSLAPAMGPDSVILPLLNGMAHLDALDGRFGAGRVIGGLCLISTMLDAEGRIRHLAPMHALSLGERDGHMTPRVQSIAAAFEGATFDLKLSETIEQDMWEKWMFIAIAAGLTCVARGTIGDLVQAGGTWMAEALIDECAGVLTRHGHAPREAAMARNRAVFMAPGSPLTASMFRDLEQGGRIEAEQILGDLLHRAEGQDTPVLRIAATVVRSYEARRARESAAHAHP